MTISPRMIKIIGDPQPRAKKPDFVKEAYEGLLLRPSFTINPGEDEKYPNGAYMVELEVLLSAMCKHHWGAYQWLASAWFEEQGMRIYIPFPFEVCEKCEMV